MNLKHLEDAKVLITGGAGSLGRAIVKQILKANPSQIVIYSRDEAKHAKYYYEKDKIKCIVGDIRDYDKLLLSTKNMDYVFHAAALKRIDTMEHNPMEAIRTNIDGSINVAKAAYYNNVEKVTLVSTDKACMSINAYGSTKFLAEKVFSYWDYEFGDETVYASVRYGNVIASRGSFIPIWLKKIKDGEKIPITVGEMTRFLFTLDDAANVVIGAQNYSQGGEIFIPKIKSYKVYDIMNVLAKYYNIKLETEEIGKRPGEKFHEDLIMPIELDRTYDINDLLVVIPELSRREYTYKKKYDGPAMNSEFFVEHNHDKILKIIKQGIRL
ncbi:MAG: SDR family NAD(P)-dependent oxidoreductase [Thermoplasmatales archaeon]|nr:SDR family NAD(P)-dependent oxidoreductase [Thermoplasmatales archaeon]